MLFEIVGTAFKQLANNRVYTLLGVICLALGVSSMVAAYGFSAYLGSFDGQFRNAGRIFTLYHGIKRAGESNDQAPYPYVPIPLADYLTANFDDIDAIAREQPFEAVVTVGDWSSYRRIRKVDPPFFQIFDLPVVFGEAGDPLASPGAAVVTTQAAMTLFGTQAAVGRRFGLEGGYDFLVTAVVADVPGPSHLGQSILERFDGGFDILIRYDFNLPTQPLDPRSIGQPEFWFGWDVLTHVLLPENGTLTPDMLSERLQSLVDRSLSPDIGLAKFDVRPVSEFVIWRLNQMVFGARTSIRITHVIFSLSCSILVLGLLTYVNLSTAQLRSRARTIAVRQVSGASRGRIAAYLLSEVAIASTLALLASVLLLVLITPAINSKLHSLISIPFGSASFWVFMLVLMVVVFCIAGVYPAVASARSSPSAILRASCSPDSSGALRMLLVGIQFSLASALFAAVVVVSQQNAELRRATSLPGPDRYVVIASDLDDAGLELEELGNALTGQPAILGFTGLGTFPWRIWSSSSPYATSPDQSIVRHLLEDRIVSYDYFKTLKISILAGREFSREVVDEALTNESNPSVPHVVIDRAAASRLGWVAPDEALGELIYKRSVDEMIEPFRVIGIAEDAPLRVMTRGQGGGIVYYLDPSKAAYPVIRVATPDIAFALRQIDDVWNSLSPDYPIQRHLLDEDYDRAVAVFDSLGYVVALLAVLSFVVSVFGLVAIASYLTEQRRNEIAIRKCFGATAGQVVGLFLSRLLKPVIIATLLSVPLTAMWAQNYLRLFVAQVALTPMPFVCSVVTIVLISALAVICQVWKAAKTKPALVLRHE